ncbi:MAG: amidohydrolase [Oscillospiraceae bacterium]|nr:amidohydrolase [Oscillospiraceae bacterium]
MKIIDTAKKYEDYIINLRRYFHENPELSGREENTVARICRELAAMGIDYIDIPNGGILGIVKGERDNGRAVLLRADIDALPVQETDENLKHRRTCKSKTDGVMHACGHDGHTAMLLGTAKILLEKKASIEGTVYLCFERGEEATDNMRQIIAYIETHGIKVDSCFTIHLAATLESGKFGLNDKDMLACAMLFDVTLEGQGGHGSRPDASVNPIDAFVAIYNGLLSIRLQKIDPYKTLTYSVGAFNSGNAINVIPQTARFGGTMRTFDREGAGMVFYNELKTLIENTCRAYHCKPTYNLYTIPGLATVNDPACAQFARQLIADQVGAENVVATEPWMGGDSFSHYQRMWPGVYTFLGIADEEKGTGAAHHNHMFDIDESVLYKGSGAAAAYALGFLADGPETESRKSKITYREVMVTLGKEKDIPYVYGEE